MFIISIGKRLASYQIAALTFLILILIGTAILMLPAASAAEKELVLVDAFFTATSAVCVTGLVVVDTATQFSLFGQMVIITLIQLGGLGIMTFATLLSVAIGKKINLRERLLLQETLNQEVFSGVVRLALHVVKYTFLIEFIFWFAACNPFIPCSRSARNISRILACCIGLLQCRVRPVRQL